MVISQTPLRISFVGGGTDLKSFYSRTPGIVLSTAIDKYVYVIIKERFDEYIYVGWSNKRESVLNVEDIEHDLVREALMKTGIKSGVEVSTLADIPSAGSGLGSSSSLTVGLLNAMYQYQGIQVSSERLAREACEIEIDKLNNPIGKQDQYIAAYGGVREIIFNADETVLTKLITFSNNNRRIFGSNILLYYTDLTRKSSSILTKQKAATNTNLETLIRMRDQVSNFKEILESGSNFDKLGVMLNDAWQFKKSLAPNITNKKIDEMYKLAKLGGASGGKISGAGGGGFLMLYVNREKQNKVRSQLNNYREFPFMLEPHGSKIVFNAQRGYLK